MAGWDRTRWLVARQPDFPSRSLARASALSPPPFVPLPGPVSSLARSLDLLSRSLSFALLFVSSTLLYPPAHTAGLPAPSFCSPPVTRARARIHTHTRTNIYTHTYTDTHHTHNTQRIRRTGSYTASPLAHPPHAGGCCGGSSSFSRCCTANVSRMLHASEMSCLITAIFYTFCIILIH